MNTKIALIISLLVVFPIISGGKTYATAPEQTQDCMSLFYQGVDEKGKKVSHNDIEMSRIIYAAKKIVVGDWTMGEDTSSEMEAFYSFSLLLEHPQMEERPLDQETAVVLPAQDLADLLYKASSAGLVCGERSKGSDFFVTAAQVRVSIRDASLLSEVSYIDDMKKMKEHRRSEQRLIRDLELDNIDLDYPFEQSSLSTLSREDLSDDELLNEIELITRPRSEISQEDLDNVISGRHGNNSL